MAKGFALGKRVAKGLRLRKGSARIREVLDLPGVAQLPQLASEAAGRRVVLGRVEADGRALRRLNDRLRRDLVGRQADLGRQPLRRRAARSTQPAGRCPLRTAACMPGRTRLSRRR